VETRPVLREIYFPLALFPLREGLAAHQTGMVHISKVIDSMELNFGEPVPETKTPRKRTLPPDIQLRFNEWWALWPKKVDKDDAERAFAKIIGRDQKSFQRLMRTTSYWNYFQYTRMMADKRERDFVPYPATFLNKGRWKEPPPEFHDWAERAQQNGVAGLKAIAEGPHEDVRAEARKALEDLAK